MYKFCGRWSVNFLALGELPSAFCFVCHAVLIDFSTLSEFGAHPRRPVMLLLKIFPP